LKFLDENKNTLSNVVHVPQLSKKIDISEFLSKKWSKDHFYGDLCRMVKGVRVVTKGSRLGTLYHLDAVIENKRESVIVVVPNTSPMEIAKLWHEHLGYIRQKALEQLKSKGMLINIGDCNFDFCKIV